MGGGPEGHAGGSEGHQGQPRAHEIHFERLAEEHDEAARAVKQRRAGSRFRYRRKGLAAHYPRTVQDAQLHVFFYAALWISLVAAGVSTIGSTAFGTDTGSGWTSVRTAVENRFTPMTSSCTLHTQPHGFSAHDFTTATPGFRRAYATFCYSRLWPTSAHASLQPQRTCISPCIFMPSPPATRPSLPTAHQLQPAPPITCNRPPAHSDRADSSSLPASLRPAAPPACRPNCPGRLAWTRRLLGRTAQRLHASKPCHAGFHGTLQKYFKENSNKKTAMFGCNNASEEPGGYVRTSAPDLSRSLGFRVCL
jgi:hypothetical protein